MTGASDKSERPRDRAERFCEEYGLRLPILLAPMAGACPPGLSIAVTNAGGMGAMGALMTTPEGIREGCVAKIIFKRGSLLSTLR